MAHRTPPHVSDEWLRTGDVCHLTGYGRHNIGVLVRAAIAERDRTGQEPDPQLWLIASLVKRGSRIFYRFRPGDVETYMSGPIYANGPIYARRHPAA